LKVLVVIDTAISREGFIEPSLAFDDYRFFGVHIRVGFDLPSLQNEYRCTFSNLLVDLQEDAREPCITFNVISKSLWNGKPAVVVENAKLRHLIDVFTRGSNRVRFTVRGPDADIPYSYAVDDILSSSNPVMTVGERVCVIHDRERWRALSESIIFHVVLSQTPGHTAMHAGAISYEGNGIILCGETGRGKSALTLALVLKGFKFLSDEVAFIDPHSRKVTPFPRALALRENAISMFPGIIRSEHFHLVKSLSGEDKWLVNPVSVVPSCVGTACPVKFILFLDGFSTSTVLTRVPAPEALFRCMKFSHTGAEDPFQSMLSIADVVQNSSSYHLHSGGVHETAANILDLVK
jgi:hypothetical protein